MEHRWGKRILLEIPVRLDVRPDAVNWTRNVSVSGAFIDTAPLVPVLGLLQVGIMCGDGSRTEFQRVPAYVVRVSDGGLGVEWCTFAPEPIRALLASVRAGTS